ncbi:MAG: STAS domain-containing protein [Pseudomonadota bacterium]
MSSTANDFEPPVDAPPPDGEIARLRLPPLLDSSEAAPLAGALLELRGRPLAIEAGAVRRIGALCVQVLVSARNTWAADGLGFSVVSVSDSLMEQWSLCGAPVAGFQKSLPS